MFQTLPLTARQLHATEARLQAIYDAAKLGLRGDNLALAAGLLPVEYRRLCEMDPLAQLAEQKGRADAERELSTVMYAAAAAGDAKIALDILKHKHDWVAKQQVQIDVSQQISVISALEAAERRVIDMGTVDAAADLLSDGRAGAHDAPLVPQAQERS
ncbi:MAG: hypothetical protein ACO3GP_04980 [Candidatus Limnocylindrus sp.]